MNKLITTFHKIATVLVKIKLLIVIMLLTSFTGFFSLLIFAPIDVQNIYLAPCLFTFMWALLLMLFIACFVDIAYLNHQPVSLIQRVKNLFNKIWAYSVAIMSLFLTLAVIYISSKLIQFWF